MPDSQLGFPAKIGNRYAKFSYFSVLRSLAKNAKIFALFCFAKKKSENFKKKCAKFA